VADKRDYYDVLGLSRTASAEDIKKSFRKVAMQYHPDRNPDDPEAERRMKEASEAYDVLSTPTKRQQYDTFGHAGVGGGGASADGFGFGDIFDAFFGGGRGSGPTNRGSDLRYDLTISFQEAYLGVEREIEISRGTACERCGGSGAQEGTGAETCATCGGAGQVRRAAQSFFGQVVNVTTCPACRGEGRTVKHPCSDCRGEGRVERRRRLRVKIPAGVDTNSQIRLTGEGEAGLRGGAVGDLYVVIRVKADPHLRRQDVDVIYELQLNIVQAALGDQIEIPSLDGPLAIQVPAGTQYGQTFRLQGRGMPHVRNGRRGDMFVVAQVVVPKDISSEQRQHLEAIGGLTGKPEKVSKGFFERLREAINLDL
jgi:molecular chaperone DnaJ